MDDQERIRQLEEALAGYGSHIRCTGPGCSCGLLNLIGRHAAERIWGKRTADRMFQYQEAR